LSFWFFSFFWLFFFISFFNSWFLYLFFLSPSCNRMPRGLFKHYVQIGRVALINYGPDYGKLCTIIDVIDQNRALIDGPSNVTGVERQQINLKRLSLTKFTITIPRTPRLRTLNKIFLKEGILKKWKRTIWAKKN